MTEDVIRAKLKVTPTEFREGRKQYLLASLGQISRRKQQLSWSLKGIRDHTWQGPERGALQAQKQLKQSPESWNKHFLDTELSGTRAGERGQ